MLWIIELSLGGHNHDHNHDENHNNESKPKNEPIQASNSIEYAPTNEKEFTIVSVKTNKEKISNYFKAIQINGWIAFFGDILHKTADGLAIGACIYLFLIIMLNFMINFLIFSSFFRVNKFGFIN